jgi:PAS domain S-box-containing protein
MGFRGFWRRLWGGRAGRIAMPILLVGLAMAVRASLVPLLASRAPYMFFFPVVLACAWWGGRLSGLTAVAASLFASIWLLQPIGEFAITSLGDSVMTGLFVLVGSAIALAAASAGALRAASQAEAQRTRDILDQMTVGFVVVDRSWRFVFLNAQSVGMAKLPYEKLIGQDARTLFGDATESMQAIEAVLRGGESREYEMYYPRFDRWYLQRAFPVREGAAVFVVDITERKRSEAVINEGREILTRALAAARMGYWSWDVDTGKVTWSENLEELHGQPPRSFRGTLDAFMDLVHPDDRARVQAALRQSLADGSAYEIEFRALRSDGGIEWIFGRGEVEMRGGRPVRLTGLASNVTERKRAEEGRQLLAAIVSSSEDAVISKTLDGTITSWNRAAERIFGYSAEEAVGASIRLIHPPDAEDDFLTILERVRRGERLEAFETIRRRKDGTLIDVALTVSPVHDERGNIVGASKIARDITAAKAAQREQQRTRDMYLGILGHDLRNPLNTIVASLYTLDRLVPQDSRKILPRMARSAQRMSRMIEQLLDFTRARLGEGIPVELDSGDLRDISHSVVEELEALHPHRIRFTAQSVPGCYDGDRLAQAVSNLVTNALLHGAPGQPVDVRVFSRNGHGRLEVVNRGAPIPDAVRSTIFEPFRRAEGSQDSSGLGLGLYIAREIVRAHGGSIEVQSGGDVTTFAIELPVGGGEASRTSA